LVNPAIYLFFWKGATTNGAVAGWSFSTIAAYYFLVVIASSLLIVHIEEDIAYRDIKEGALVSYLMKPFSYIQRKFIEELPWRIAQGSFGLLVLVGVMVLFTGLLHFSLTPTKFALGLCVVVLGYLVSFLFKMVVGISALWFTEYRGLSQLVEFSITIFSGIILPLEQYPDLFRQLAFSLPFSYMIYYPVMGMLGKLDENVLVFVLLRQIMWIIIFYMLYRWLWKKGLYKFTGLGQ